MNPSASKRRTRVVTSTIPSLDLRPYVAGRFVDATSGRYIEDHDPYTGDLLASIPISGDPEVHQALAAAEALSRDRAWTQGHEERRRLLLGLSEAILARHDEIAELEACDIGKPLVGVSAWDVKNAAAVYRMYGEMAGTWSDENLPAPDGYELRTTQEPVGVVAALVPWNFPFPCIAWKIAPAIAAGCCVVLKSPERAPLSAQYLAHLVDEVGFPPGAISVLAGEGHDVGSALVASPRVAKITFTGGTEIAATIMREAASHVPAFVLELGGKGANIVCDDADLDAAVLGTVTAMFDVAGENCCAGSRTIVTDAIYDRFCSQLVETVRLRRVGDPLDLDTQQGPLIDQRQVERVDSYVQGALAEGCSILTGGAPEESVPNLYPPTVLADVDPNSKVAQEEIFGPVGTIIRAKDLSDAIALANATDYGLSASIWTADHANQKRFVEEMDVGVCWVNAFGFFEIVAPWGGRKRSGYGRELGREAIKEFLTPKTVYTPT
jgi:acyl-CoA reductase-like NAD-dependent aldehyde dehydrogenase